MPAPPRLAFVDLETSGLSPGADRITEIGVVTVDDGGVEEWTTLVHPGRDLTERSRFFNGITSDELAGAVHQLDGPVVQHGAHFLRSAH